MLRRAYGTIAYLTGSAGAAIYFARLVGTGVGIWTREVGTSPPTAFAVNFTLLTLFTLQHSLMARTAYKDLFLRLFPECIERSTYVAASGLALGTLAAFWQPLPGEVVWHGPIGIVAISLAAGAGVGGCAAWFDHATFFGLQQSWTGVVPRMEKLRIEGPYRFVRHPLMLGLLVAMWALPIMPPELLMLNLGMTIYIVLAIQLEERDLIRAFGSAYEEYRRGVPALVPYRFPKTNG